MLFSFLAAVVLGVFGFGLVLASMNGRTESDRKYGSSHDIAVKGFMSLGFGYLIFGLMVMYLRFSN